MAAALAISRSDTLSKHNWGLSDRGGSVGLKSPDIISLQGTNPVLESPSGSTVCEGIEDSIRLVDTCDRVYIAPLNLEKEMLHSARVDHINFVERVEDGKDGVGSRKRPSRQSDWIVTPIDIGALKGDDRFRGCKRMESDKYGTEEPRFPLKISVVPVHHTNTAVNEVSFLDCKNSRVDMLSMQPNQPFRPTLGNEVIDHRQAALEGADDSSDEEVKGQCCRLKCRIFTKRQPVARNYDAQTAKATQSGPHPDLAMSNKTTRVVGVEDEAYPCPDKRSGQARDAGIDGHNTLLDNDEDKIWEKRSSRALRTVECGVVGNVDCDLSAAGEPVNRIGKRPWEGSEKKMAPEGSGLPELSHTVCSFCMSLEDVPLNKTNQDKVFAHSIRKMEKVSYDKTCQITTNIEGLKMDDSSWSPRQHTEDDECGEETDSLNNKVSYRDTDIEPAVSKIIDHITLCSNESPRGHGASKYVSDRHPQERANEGDTLKCPKKDVSTETVAGFPQDLDYPLVKDIGVGATEGLPYVAELRELKTLEERTASNVVTTKVIRRQVDRECDVTVPESVQGGTITRMVVPKARSKEDAIIHAQFLPDGASNVVEERRLDSPSSTIYIEDQEDPARVEGSKRNEHGYSARPVNNISERERRESWEVVSTRENSRSCLPMGATGKVRELTRGALEVTEKSTSPIQRGNSSEKDADQSSNNNSRVYGSCVRHSVGNRAYFNPGESLGAGGDDNQEVIASQPLQHSDLHPNAQVFTRVEDQKSAYSKDKTACHDKSGHDSKFHTLDNDIEVNMCLSEKVKFFIRNSWDGTTGDSGLVSLFKGFPSPSEVLEEPSTQEWDQNLPNAHDYVTKSWSSSLTGHSNQLAQAQTDHSNQDKGVAEYKEFLLKRGSQITDANQPRSFHDREVEEQSSNKGSMSHRCLPETVLTEVFPSQRLCGTFTEQGPLSKQERCNLLQQQNRHISEEDDCIYLIESDSERETWLVSAAHAENEATQVSVGCLGTSQAFVEYPTSTMTPSPNSQERCQDSQYFSDHESISQRSDVEGDKTLKKPRKKKVHSDRSENFHIWKAVRTGTAPPRISSYEKQLAARADCMKATISISPTRLSEASDAEKIGCLIELRKSLLRLARESGKKYKLETRKSSEKKESPSAVRPLQRQRIKRSMRTSSTSGTLQQKEGRVLKKHTFKMLDRRKKGAQSGTQQINRNQIPDSQERIDGSTPSRVHERSELSLSFEPRQQPEGEGLGESSGSRTATTEPDFSDSETSNVNCIRTHAEAAVPTRCKISLGSLSAYGAHHQTNSGSMSSLCEHSTAAESCTDDNVPPQLVCEEPVTAKKQTGKWKTAAVRRQVISAEKDEETTELEGDLITESSLGRLRRKWRKPFPLKAMISSEDGSEVTRGVNTDDDPWETQSLIELNAKSSSSRSGQETIVSEVDRMRPQTCNIVQIGPINEKSHCDASSQCGYQSLEENCKKVSVASTGIDHTDQPEGQGMILDLERSDEKATMCSMEERLLHCLNRKCLRSWKEAKSPSPQPRALTPTAESMRDHGSANKPTESVSQHCTQTELPLSESIGQGFTSATCSFAENLSPSKGLGSSTDAEGLSPEVAYPLALNTRTEEMHFGSHRISLVGRPLQKDVRDECLVVRSKTKSQLECNDGLNNPKAIREYRTLPALLSPNNIRVKALLTFGMERPRAVAQEKEESFNEAKQNSSDLEDKSAIQTRRREIISPKAQRFSKAAVSAINQAVAAQLTEERVCVKRQKTSQHQVRQVHKALKSAPGQAHQRSLSISEKNLYDLEALKRAAIDKKHRHPKESCWHYKAADLERVNEDLSGQIRELQNEIDSYGYLPDFIGPEINSDTFNSTLDKRENSPGCLLRKLRTFDSMEGVKLPDPDHDVDISSSNIHAVKPVSKKKKKIRVDNLHAKLEGNSSNAMNIVGSMNEVGLFYGEMQDKADGALPSWAKVRDKSPIINIWDTRKCTQEGQHLWLVHPEEQVHTAERKSSLPKLRPASPCSHRRHQKMHESVFTRPQVSQKSRPTQQELRDMDDPYVHYPSERRSSYLEKSPVTKSGMLFQTYTNLRDVDKAAAYNISRIDKFHETDGCGALHDLLGPRYTRAGSTEKSRRGRSSCNHPSSAPISVYPPRRGLFGGGRLPKRCARRSLSPKKWRPNGQVVDHRGGSSKDDVLRNDSLGRLAEFECNDISTLEQSVLVTSGQLHAPACHQPNTKIVNKTLKSTLRSIASV